MPDKPGPMQAAQRAMRPPLPKRFYKTVSVAAENGNFAVLLDGKSMKTSNHSEASGRTTTFVSDKQ